MEAYQFINVEAALIGVVRSMAQVAASVEVLSPRPVEFVQVVRVGGPSDFVTDQPMVSFFVWAPSWAAAWELAELVRKRVLSVRSLDGQPVYSVAETGGLARAPDPADGNPRYQFTAQLRLRGSSAP